MRTLLLIKLKAKVTVYNILISNSVTDFFIRESSTQNTNNHTNYFDNISWDGKKGILPELTDKTTKLLYRNCN